MNPFIEDLRARGILKDITPGLEEYLNSGSVSGYIGFDPTSDSLHIGNLAQIILLKRFRDAGHKPYILIGSATASIGDPSGKSSERNLIDPSVIYWNTDSITNQLKKLFPEELSNPVLKIVDNSKWMGGYSFLEFIREIGKHFSINTMLAKDSVKSRLESGISFTEFSYQLIQAYDFCYLNRFEGVTIQMGGSDQWGNISSGLELIRKKDDGRSLGKASFGLTISLVTKSDGSKFGKSESGNIWLDPKKTTPYEFYQFWMNISDEDAIKLLPIFSLRSVEDCNVLVDKHLANPSTRHIQTALAEEMTIMVHGQKDLDDAKFTSAVMFGSSEPESLKLLSLSMLEQAIKGLPKSSTTKEIFKNPVNSVQFLFDTGIFPSKGEARKMLDNNGVSFNRTKITKDFELKEEHLLHEKYLLVQVGKKRYVVDFPL